MGSKYDKYIAGDIIKGLRLISQPYKINGKSGYGAMVKCIMCDKEPYEIPLSEIQRHTYDGCPDCAKKQRFKTHEQFVSQMKDIAPNIIIVGTYTESKKKVECVCGVCDYEFSAFPNNLLRGHGCKKCANTLISTQKRRTHDDFVKNVNNLHPNIEIIGIYVRSSETVRCKCKIDGYEWDAWPDHLLAGHGCAVCGANKLMVGYNDVATVRPDLIKYFKNVNEASMFAEHSNKYADLICPNCGYQKYMSVGHLSKTGFACPVCGDGVSYPNKFCRQVLRQLPVCNLQFEYTSDWTETYLYDNYFEYNGCKYIVEADGIQHFKETSGIWSSLAVVQQIDHIKTQLAENNGCTVIRIDCRKSEMKYIKNSILNSSLSNIFDLHYIDWLACENNARSSLLKQICDFYNSSGDKRLKYIAEKFNVSCPTVRKYLQRGTNLGMCNYCAKPYQLGVIAYDVNNNSTFTFPSISMCARELSDLYHIKIEQKGILRVCRNESESYKGFIFKLKDGEIYEKIA